MGLVEQVLEKSILGIMKGMSVIRLSQRGFEFADKAEIKSADETLVTKTDKQVEKIMFDCLSGISGTKFFGEEGTESGDGEYWIMVDPLDGTRAFALRISTSTIIVAVVHPERGVVGCLIAEPSTGRVWTATEHQSTQMRVFLDDGVLTAPKKTEVWTGVLTDQASIFLDVSHGFKRKKGQILTNQQAAKLVANISLNVKLFMPGSNGLHFALVANGGEYAAGQITTAVGGPWDIAGVLLVLQAGGAARGFAMENGQLVEKNPLMILDCDIIISGNSEETVDKLVKIIFDSI